MPCCDGSRELHTQGASKVSSHLISPQNQGQIAGTHRVGGGTPGRRGCRYGHQEDRSPFPAPPRRPDAQMPRLPGHCSSEARQSQTQPRSMDGSIKNPPPLHACHTLFLSHPFFLTSFHHRGVQSSICLDRPALLSFSGALLLLTAGSFPSSFVGFLVLLLVLLVVVNTRLSCSSPSRLQLLRAPSAVTV